MRLRNGLRQSVIIALLASSTVAGSAWADSVLLKNGAEYDGILKTANAETVVIQSDGADWTFARDKVASFQRDHATAAWEKVKAREAAAAMQAQREVVPVLMYSTAWCPVCRRARAYMQANHIVFVDKDIEKDKQAHDEMIGKCNARHVACRGVPIIDVNGRLLLGFDEQALSRLLAKRAHRSHGGRHVYSHQADP